MRDAVLCNSIRTVCDRVRIAVDENRDPFGFDDLVVVQRHNGKAFITEVWTHRDFDAKELILAPASNELKEKYWTKGSSQRITIPSGSAFKGKLVHMDGRGRSSMFTKDGCAEGQEEQRGCLYWIIERTSDPKEANLVVQSAMCTATYEIALPNGTKIKQKTPSSELPQCPLLVNPKKIKAYTRLYALTSATSK